MWMMCSVKTNEMKIINTDHFCQITETMKYGRRMCCLWHPDASLEGDERNVFVNGTLSDMYNRLLSTPDVI